jgi:hypothetical protein
VYPYKKGGRNDQVATGSQRRKYISYRAIRPFDVLQHLIRDDEIELSIKGPGTDVEVGILGGTIGFEVEGLLPSGSRPYFQGFQAFGSKRANKFEAPLIHDDT